MSTQESATLLSSYLLPDQWVPHVTIAARLDNAQVAQIVSACQQCWQPIHGIVAGLTLRIIPNKGDHVFRPLADHS